MDRPIAGKTGTTNDSKDAWFVGFTPDLAVGVYIGFDDPKSLGDKETGGSLAVPVFKEFMKLALDGTPPTPFRVPTGVSMVQVNSKSGRPTSSFDPNAIWEPFLDGTQPENDTTYGPMQASTENNQDGVYSSASGIVLDAEQTNDMLTPNPDNNSSPSLEGTGGVY